MKRLFISLLVSIAIAGNLQAQIVSISSTPVLCFGECTGSATVTAQPSGNYRFLWSNGDTTQTTHNLCAGNYACTVNDSAGNFIDSVAMVLQQPTALSVTGNVINVSCFGSNDGTIQISVSGGTPPYSYQWSCGAITTGCNNLPGGNYTVIITDANGCTVTATYTLNEPQELIISTTVQNVLCPGTATGSIDITVTGGTPPYTYVWSPGFSTEDLSGIPAGTYTTTITDANGCTETASATVTESFFQATATSTPESSCGACDGTVTAIISGGTLPVLYLWSNGATGQTITGLCQGTYSATITDQNNCSASVQATVFSNISVSIINHPNSYCNIPDTAEIAFSGGAPPYTIGWGDGNISQVNSSPAFHIYTNPGIYTITVSDTTGCTGGVLDTIQSAIYIALAEVIQPTCNGNNNGKIKVNVTGVNSPFSLLWSNGATEDSITNLYAGTYTLAVTDSAGCTESFSYNLLQSTGVSSYYVYLSRTNPNCTDNGSITATAYSGTPPYTYLWNTNPPQTTQTITGLGAGSYSVTVTDTAGCERYASIVLTPNCSNIITGRVFNDANGNCVTDSGETFAHHVTVSAVGSQTYFGNTNANGEYTIRIATSGTFVLSGSYPSWYHCGNLTFCSPTTVNFPGLGDTVVNNLGISISSGFDLYLHPGWSSANPGFQKTYWIFYGNQGSVPFTGNATVRFFYDPNLIYLHSLSPLIPVHDIANHSLTWVVNNVGSTWTGNNRPRVEFLVPATLPLGYQLKNDFYIEPYAGDCDTADNHLHFSEPVTGSLDPNEKQVEPAGDILEQDSVLTYTIHFQNTGTDTTWFVILKDTLSNHLNPTSVQNVASSHPITEFDISGTGIFTWVFNPIFLVDSTTNEEESKGFVKFTVKKKAGLPIGTSIENTAAIYFDYNQPIITNTVSSTLQAPVRVKENATNNVVKIFPNPAQDKLYIESKSKIIMTTLFDICGKVVMSSSDALSNYQINLSDFASGCYIIKVDLKGSEEYHRFFIEK